MSSNLFCELCGTKISSPIKVLIDGVLLSTCLSCSKRGKPYESKSKPHTTQHITLSKPTFKTSSKISTIKNVKSQIKMSDSNVLDHDFGRIIQKARLKKGLTQEQLANELNEKVTLIKKFENGTLKPNETLAKKLGRILAINLYINLNEDDDNN